MTSQSSPFSLDLSGGLGRPVVYRGGAPVASLERGDGRLSPGLRLSARLREAGREGRRLQEELDAWLRSELREHLAPLFRLEADLAGKPREDDAVEAAPLSGVARGIAFRLGEHFGVLPRAEAEPELGEVDQEARRGLRRHRIRIGAHNLFIPVILRPAPTRWRLVLWALWESRHKLPDEPAPGMVWSEMARRDPRDFYRVAGFHPAGQKAVRVDMIERLADAVRPLGADGGGFEVSPDVMGLVGLSGKDFAAVMKSIGYSAERISETPAPAAKGQEKTAGEEKKKNEAAEEAAPRYRFRWAGKGKRPARGAKSSGRAGGRRKKSRPEPDRPGPDSPFASLAGLKKSLQKGKK